MENNIFDKIHEFDLKKTMENSYIDYAMSVIAASALPDVRDGLKPVQRRVLYSMIELNNGPDKPHRKCARIVGDTMGKYHPHGDSSLYGALVNMAQEWSTRYPLVDGHGNFGSVDGDGAAAMRYTEARLSKISMELPADINNNTVDFGKQGCTHKKAYIDWFIIGDESYKRLLVFYDSCIYKNKFGKEITKFS